MKHFSLANLFSQRPLQARDIEAQYAELDIDPSGRSLIEQRMGEALLRLILRPEEFGPPTFINLFLPCGSVRCAAEMPHIALIKPGVINIAPGVWIDDWQADFLLHVKAPGKRRIVIGAVECDGHQFHNATPEQVSRDRARDREFQSRGITVLRYPGWEVHDRAEHFAGDAIAVLLRLSEAAV